MRLVSFLAPFAPSAARPWRAGRRLATALAALLPVLAPAAALAAETPPAAERGTPRSLDFYFAALAAAPDDASAARARGRLEAHWNASGSATADLLVARAAIAVDGGDPALALDLADAAVVLAPGWAEARHRRAVVHLADHDIAHALDDLGEVLRLEPRHIGALALLATAMETAGRKREALQWLRRLATIDPRNPAVAADRLERLRVEVEGREL